jgi:hypothetical protein
MAEMTQDSVAEGAAELAPPRRVVTGHDEQGRSIILSDGPAPHRTSPPQMPQLKQSVLWVTDCSPASIAGDADTAPAELEVPLGPPPGGTLLRTVDFPPDTAYDGVDVGALARRVNHGEDPRDGVPPDSAERHFWFHKTSTLDYAIVLEGEIWALVDEGETCLRPGDVLIQRGTSHSWSNRTDRPARVAFILVDATDDAG